MKTVCGDAVSQSRINDINIKTLLLYLLILRVLLTLGPYYRLESCILIQVLSPQAIYWEIHYLPLYQRCLYPSLAADP